MVLRAARPRLRRPVRRVNFACDQPARSPASMRQNSLARALRPRTLSNCGRSSKLMAVVARAWARFEELILRIRELALAR